MKKELWVPPAKRLLRPRHTAFANTGAFLGTTQEDSGGGGGDWPDAFMSYSSSGAITLSGETGVTIDYLSFEGLERPTPRPIYLYNCENILIERIDTRKCTMGLVYAEDCGDITVRYCRVENIAYEFIDDVLGTDFSNDNDCNLYQFNNVDGFYCHHIKGRYGNTEDVLSHFSSSNGEVHDVYWEGGINDGHDTSDSSRSCFWTSDSGTGCIMGDDDGENVYVHDSSFVNPGQVGLAIAGGSGCTFDNVTVYQESSSQPINTAAYVWGQYSVCTGHAVTNCAGYFNGGGGFWDGGNCGSIDLSGSDFEDSGLDPDDYRVSL
jgi:hypothetical protein